MLGWILRRIKWAALALLALPFLFAFISYTTTADTNEMLQDGVETVAQIEGGKRRTGRRSGTSFSLNLTWQDAQGKPRSATGVTIPRALADRIIVDDMLTIDTLKIRYLPNDTSKNPVLADGLGKVGNPIQAAVSAAATTLPMALLGGLVFWFLRRRDQRQAAAQENWLGTPKA
jgi:hypothetical protein